jgi:hypothetical protein
MSIDVRATILARIDPSEMRGIEIGPLHNPRLSKEEANIRYLDHESKEGLLLKYAGNPEVLRRVEHLVDVDYIWTPGKRMVDVVDDWAPVDYVIASHVIEHTGNMIDWLAQNAELLGPGGVLSLVIPDKRYCFDARRGITPLASYIDAYLRNLDRPTLAQIFDHESNFMGGSGDGAALAAELWAGMDPMSMLRDDVPNALRFALDRCAVQVATGEYMDVHASVFTPHSFVDILSGVAEVGLTNFGIAEIVSTQAGFYEFYVTLQRLDIDDAESLLAEQRSSCQRARQQLDAQEAEQREPAAPTGHLVDVSSAEERLLQVKRSVMSGLRRVEPWARASVTKIRGGARKSD